MKRSFLLSNPDECQCGAAESRIILIFEEFPRHFENVVLFPRGSCRT